MLKKPKNDQYIQRQKLTHIFFQLAYRANQLLTYSYTLYYFVTPGKF